MISRIAIVCLLAGAASAAEPPAASPEPFSEVDGIRVLSADLSVTTDAATLEKISAALKQEGALAKGAPERAIELQFVRALLSLNRNELDRAVELFALVPADHSLRDAALFFRARALRLRAAEAARNRNDARAAAFCREARWALFELADLGTGPFRKGQAEESRKAVLCEAAGLVGNGRIEEAKPLLFSLLSRPSELPTEDREPLLATLLMVLGKEKDPEERSRLAEESRKAFPDSTPLRSFALPLPEEPKPSLPPPKELPPAKPRTAPEDSLFREATAQAARGNARKAIEGLTRIIREYPGSIAAAKASAKIQIVLETTLAKSKQPPPFLKELRPLPSKMVYSLGKSLWDREFPSEAADFFEQVVRNDPTSGEAGSSVFFLGRIEEDRGDWTAARGHFERLVTAYSSSTYLDRSYFKVGWLSLLLGDLPKAIEWLEYDRARADNPVQKAEDLYWLSKAHEKAGNPEKAEACLKEIGLLAPVSYYGFLADRMLPLSEGVPSPTGEETFRSPWNRYRIRRAKAFLSVGLPGAAAEVLREVDLDADPDGIREVALLYNAARSHAASISIAARLINRAGESSLPKDLAKAFFPVGYEQTVYAEAAANQLDPLLLFSLIKQESAYREDAESRAGALGLMQLMPKTAREVAQEMSESVPERNELLLSSRNVKLGARYVASLLKKYEGNLVYALACYNAGPTRVDAWKNRWGKLPAEIFVELIPFEETRNYVKSILRNYAYYARILENRNLHRSTLLPSGS